LYQYYSYDDELLQLLSTTTFNVTRTQCIKDHTLITALRQCWSCETPPLISNMNMFFEYSLLMSTFTHSFHIFLPPPLIFIPSTSNSLHAYTQSLLSLRSTCPYHLSRPYFIISSTLTTAKKLYSLLFIISSVNTIFCIISNMSKCKVISHTKSLFKMACKGYNSPN